MVQNFVCAPHLGNSIASQHANLSHVNIHQVMYLCLRLFSVTNSMLYLRVERHKILGVEVHVGSII
jgi:hypothetical protein